MQHILVSVSGGRTSMMMAHLMNQKYKDDPSVRLHFVFANTGQEHEETLKFMVNCQAHFGIDVVWVEAITNPQHRKGVKARIVDFDTASRDGRPFRDMIAKHGIPNMMTAHCTREMKDRAIQDYMRQIGVSSYKVAIGIRADEPKRLKWKKVEAGKVLYPMATEFPASRHDVAAFWARQPFDLELKSYEGNCKTCWKKSKRKLMTIALENPEWFEFFREMESSHENYTPPTRMHNNEITPPHRFFRGNMSVDDIFEEAAMGGFDLALDESKEANRHKMMMLWEDELDSNGGCGDSCEVEIEEEE